MQNAPPHKLSKIQISNEIKNVSKIQKEIIKFYHHQIIPKQVQPIETSMYNI